MKISLKAKVSIFITLVIIIISSISTYLFTSAHSSSKERGRIIRGTALCYALSKAAEEGLINEDLDLIKKASYIIKAQDVLMAQVYSSIWDAIDAYPFEKLKERPVQDAVRHFNSDPSPFYLKTAIGYDFYSPIFFRVSPDSPQVVIGYGRIVLSSRDIQKEISGIIVTNIIVSGTITLLAIFILNILISRIVIKPVMNLHKSVSMFKNGVLPDTVQNYSGDEIGELSLEFNKMSHTIKENTDKLIDSEKRIKSLFERVEHAIFRLDKDGNIIEANSKFNKMFGNIKTLCTLVMSEQKSIDCMKDAFSGKLIQIEEKVMGKQGDELTVLLSVYPEMDSEGKIKGYDGYIIDLTEKKRLEERLIRSQKLEAVGTLAGGIAHDFNNVLTAILGYAEIIQSMTREGDPFYKPASIILEAAKKGADFSKKILSVTRKEKIETRPVNINDIVRDSMELLQRSIPKNIEVITRLADGIPNINADPSQIQQVIINLAVNSRDAMPEGGKLTIETSIVGKENGAASNMPKPEAGFIKLAISDTGLGIDKETQKKIFDPFFTTKSLGKGTGLGLYIVHSIIHNHGGYINLYSEPLQGTRFNIYLPVTQGTEAGESDKIEDLSGSGTILIIDDESDVRELCKDMLEPLGYKVIQAGDGNTGINIYREMKDDISLVLLDMVMPRMNGNEAFQALKTIDDNVKVLICSGYSRDGFTGISDLMKSGVAGFLQKPFSRQAMAVAIKKALSGDKS